MEGIHREAFAISDYQRGTGEPGNVLHRRSEWSPRVLTKNSCCGQIKPISVDSEELELMINVLNRTVYPVLNIMCILYIISIIISKWYI